MNVLSSISDVLCNLAMNVTISDSLSIHMTEKGEGQLLPPAPDSQKQERDPCS